MKNIKCPSCGETFTINQNSFDELLSQIKKEEFTKELNERLQIAEKEKLKEIELTKSKIRLENDQ